MRESLIYYKQIKKKTKKKHVDKSFCPPWSHNCSVPKKHTEVRHHHPTTLQILNQGNGALLTER